MCCVVLGFGDAGVASHVGLYSEYSQEKLLFRNSVRLDHNLLVV